MKNTFEMMYTERLTSLLKYVLITLPALLLFICCTNKKDAGSNQNLATVPTEPGWDNLFDGKSLDGWEITSFGTEGPVQVSSGTIVLGMGDGCTGITWKGDFPTSDYELQLQAKKVTGNDFFCGITFPVDSSFCSFIAGGWGGPVVGISSIDGKDASENETRKLKKFEHDVWYHIRVRVSESNIKAWIDDEKFVDLNTRGKQLSTRPEVNLSKPFGICSWTTTAAIKDIQIKKLE